MIEILTLAILAWFGQSAWFECGNAYRTQAEKTVRASAYAALIAEHTQDVEEGLVFAGILAQESGFNECSVGNKTRELAKLGLNPTKAQVVKALGSQRARNKIGVHFFDAGVAQILWPSGSHVGMGAGVTLADALSADTSIKFMVMGLRKTHLQCSEIKWFKGTIDLEGKTYPYKVRCDDAYWVGHHSPRKFRYEYFRNVSSDIRQMLTEPQLQLDKTSHFYTMHTSRRRLKE